MYCSPLRYPGGKGKFAPCVKEVMHTSGKEYNTYIEPFAGGAGVALELLFSGEVSNIVINDYDKAIYSFWRAILTEHRAFIELIEQTPITIDEWRVQKDIYDTCADRYSLELGFATFFLNRTNRSGILNAGPIGGYNQTGNYLIDARFNKDELIKRINQIASRRNQIRIYNKEARSFIKGIISKYGEDAFVYFDPPYYNKGNVLYKNCLTPDDHLQIAECINDNVNCDWIISYDNEEKIKEIYRDRFFIEIESTYSIVKSNVKSEIIIFKDMELCPKSLNKKRG